MIIQQVYPQVCHALYDHCIQVLFVFPVTMKVIFKDKGLSHTFPQAIEQGMCLIAYCHRRENMSWSYEGFVS